MRVTITRIALLALVAGILAAPSTAVADGWFSKMGRTKETTLGEVLRHPDAFVDVRVEFKLYFNQPGESYNPYYTRFTEELYGNFTAWPIDARLYEKRDYQRTYQFFFMARSNSQWKKIQGLDRMTVIEVTGYVREVFRGQPWIEVEKFSTSSGGLRPRDVRYVINGDAYYAAGKYQQAKRYYKKALSRRLPDLVRADLYRRLGDAQFHAGKFRDAMKYYYSGLDKAPRSLVLQQGVRAAKAAMKRSGVETAPQPAPRTRAVTKKDNDVWEIIQLMEDPAEVEAEVARWHLELEKRAALLRETVGVTAVSDEEDAEDDVEEDEDDVDEDEDVVEESSKDEMSDDWGKDEVVDERHAEDTSGESSVKGDTSADRQDSDWADRSRGEVVEDDPRIVMVAGQVIRLPRLPFIGCADVSVRDMRSIVEEIVRNPDQ